jgi:ribosomal protein S7
MRLAKRSITNVRRKDKFYIFSYVDCLIRLFIRRGNKFYAYKILYKFFFLLKKKYRLNIEYLFKKVFKRYVPIISFLSKKIAANVYQLPWLIDKYRARFVLIRWFFRSVKMRTEAKLLDRLYNEFNELVLGYGRTVQIVEDYYYLALKNRPFLKYIRKRRKVFLSRLKKFGVK